MNPRMPPCTHTCTQKEKPLPAWVGPLLSVQYASVCESVCEAQP